MSVMGLLRILVVGSFSFRSLALSTTRGISRSSALPRNRFSKIYLLRGGEGVTGDEFPSDVEPSTTASTIMPKLSVITTALASVGRVYSRQLEQRPILTKSYTAGA